MKLSFTFYIGHAGKATRAPATATAELRLSIVQLENFRALRDIAVEKDLASVEVYVHGVNWVAPAPTLETGDFIVCARRGIALKAFSPATHGAEAIQSHWIDWATLDMDLLNYIEDEGESTAFDEAIQMPQTKIGNAHVAH